MQGVVELEEESSEAVRCMLEFIYGFDYDAGPVPEHIERMGTEDRSTC